MRWELRYNGRPWTINSERGRGGKKTRDRESGHWGEHNEEKLQWRGDFKILAKEAKIPPCQFIRVIARQYCRNRVMPDPGAIFPAIKAAIDGLVDARVIPKDTGEFVRFLGFTAPEAVGEDYVILEVEGEPVAAASR